MAINSKQIKMVKLINHDVTVNKELDSIIMKTKPNFTYKEFIQKISHVNLTQKNEPQAKSPKALKSHNKNVPSFSAINCDRGFQKRSVNRDNSRSNSPTPKHSPRKVQMKENTIEVVQKNMTKPVTSIKSNTSKKLQLKNHTKPPSQLSKPSTTKHSKSIRQNSNKNFYHNEPSFIDQRHNESCSTFYRNNHYDNEEDQFHNQSEVKKCPSQYSKLTSKKHSTSSIEGKIKIGTKGNLTDRNMQRVNTQYYEEVRRPEQRVNTQYQRNDSKTKDRMSPSFYKLSIDESSLLDLEQDKTHKHLFPQSSTSRTKKSTISLYTNPQQKTKMTPKSHEHIYNKFISKISQTLFQITKIDTQSKLLEHKVKYIEFLQCLKELKMIKSDYEPYSQGVDLVKELWEELVMGQNVNHFIIIVALILKITPLQNIRAEAEGELQNYVYIQKKYEQFRFTRLQLDKSKLYSEKESIEYYNFPFKPTISKVSEQLVSQSRSQKKYKISTSSNHNQSTNTYSKRENISISNQMQNFHNNSMLRSTSPLGNKRSDILYKQAKKKSLQKRENKSTVDYEYEKNREELTFKPKLIIKRKKQPKTDQIPQNDYVSPRFAIDEEKAINRLIRGRVQKQVKQKALQKGLPYNEKVIEKMMKERYEQIIRGHNESRMKYNQNQNGLKLNQTHLKLNQSKLNLMNETHKLNESKAKLTLSQIHNRSRDDRSIQGHKQETSVRCSTQVQQLQSIHNLSFQQEDQNLDKQNQQISNEQRIASKIQSSPLRSSNFSYQNDQVSQQQPEQHNPNHDDFFSLDIYYEQDKSDKLMIRRDACFEEIVEQTQRFALSHNLSKEMANKLKQEVMIAMKYHDVEKIQENAEEDQCSLLG